MINSSLDPSITYNETQKVLEEDIDHNTSVYESEILGKNVEMVLGKERKEGSLSYFIAYVLLKTGKVRPIGIFEITTDQVDTAIDKDGDIEIEKLKGPLLFTNVDLSDTLVPERERESESESDKPPIEVKSATSEFPDATRKAEDKEKEIVSTGLWIQQFMENKNYGITDNEGGGDCLFAVIRDACQQIGIEYTVGDLRKKLSTELSEETFQNYRHLYDSFTSSMKQIRENLKQISAENNELKVSLPKETDTEKQVSIVNRAKVLKEQFYDLKNQLDVTQHMLNEQKFMKNVKSVDQFRAMINTCKFWGDTWAISTLERVLNMKFILFSQENFDDGDLDNVLQCGQLNDKILEEKGNFTPDYYIIMSYDGSHYQLITYKSRGIFSFKQLPYGIRDIIVNKCLEKMAGPYSIIPDFVTEKLDNKEDPQSITTLQEINYDPDIVFVYYSRSSGKPLPGKGSGEKIPHDQRDNFKGVASIKDWRKKLSNEWIAPIDIDGHQWQSVEHYYQGSKYAKGHPQIYYQFTLDSQSQLGKIVEKAKNFKDVEPDMSFAGKSGERILEKGLEAKFTQHPELGKALLLTKNALLKQYIPKSPPKISSSLMKIRNNLTL